jgi:hypothetical protein
VVRSSVAVVALSTLLLTGCAPEAKEGVSLGELEHIHSVATDGDDFFLASHHGLYLWAEDSWHLQGDEFDVMGLAIDEGVFYASGHPGPTQEFPDPLGILISTDEGQTWTPQVLTGEVDFHLLEAVRSSFVGVAANYGVAVASRDAGRTWSTLNPPPLTSLAVNPLNSKEVLVASEGLLHESTDMGATFTPLPSPAGVVFVEWTQSTVFLATDSTLYEGPNTEGPFSPLNQTFTSIAAIGAHASAVIVLDEQGVHVSRDAGKSFELLP